MISPGIGDIRLPTMAMEHGLALVTRDEHFTHVDGLKKMEW